MDTSFGQSLPATPAQDNPQYMVPMKTPLDDSTHQGTGLLLVGSLTGKELKILSSNMYNKAVNRMFGTPVVCGAFC